LIWLAYLSIPAVLVYFTRRRRDIPFSWMFWMFGAFIVSCGFTHFMEVVTFYRPAYRLSGLVKLVTAVVSWATVIGLMRVIPTALSLMSPRELEQEITERKRIGEELQRARGELEERVKDRTAALTEANAALQKGIAERKRTEEALRASQEQLTTSNATLEQRVAERTATAEQQAEELARSNSDLQQFAYVASHDLQEPLRMVASYLELLARRYQGQLDAKADKYIAYAVDGATRMQTLIQDLLTLARVVTHAKPSGPTDCAAVVDQVCADLRPAIEEKGAAVTRDELPTVWADRTQLGQVFQNLISNALKFCDREAPRVHVGARGEGADWVFSVRDNGIGIAAEDSERIFLIFQRLHTRARYPGTGIGLAVCKKVVERHGGRIWVESQPGKGSVFFFTLPAREPPASRCRGGSGTVPAILGGEQP
jgi:signal transduction histidine kinase